jgi:hypothetical protein
VEPLKDPEQLVGILHVEPHPVVADEDRVPAVARSTPDLDGRHLARAGVLDGIREQVGEYDLHEAGVALHRGELADQPPDQSVPHINTEFLESIVYQRGKWRGTGVHFLTPQLSQIQQIIHQPPHVLGTFLNPAEIVLRFGVETRPGVLHQDPGEAIDLAQRGPEIVGHRIGEGLQLPVRRSELGRTVSDSTLEALVQVADPDF